MSEASTPLRLSLNDWLCWSLFWLFVAIALVGGLVVYILSGERWR